jgi:DNA invertase Pin-like site-specific DNA recombinase
VVAVRNERVPPRKTERHAENCDGTRESTLVVEEERKWNSRCRPAQRPTNALEKRQQLLSHHVRLVARKMSNGLCVYGYDEQQVTWFIDKETGKTLQRPQFERLQQAIFNGEISTVVIWKLDRLSRRLRDGINVLADWCERGLKIVVVTQQIELNGAVGRMIAALLLGLAEIELEYRQERQAAGIEVAKKKGVYQGRKKGTTKSEPDRARELRAKGLKIAEIAQALGTSKRTVQRYLTVDQATAELLQK